MGAIARELSAKSTESRCVRLLQAAKVVALVPTPSASRGQCAVSAKGTAAKCVNLDSGTRNESAQSVTVSSSDGGGVWAGPQAPWQRFGRLPTVVGKVVGVEVCALRRHLPSLLR
eukprot:1221571-Alexandrium_andersonii.AAC.1